MSTTKWTIYCHVHTASGRRYVGMTKRTMERRWSQHVCQATSSKCSRNHWYNAIRAYGKDSFSHEILEICDSLEAANTAEIRWIAHFETRNPRKGFNLAPGGCGLKSKLATNPWDLPEYREKNIVTLKRARIASQTSEARVTHKAAISTPEYKAKRVEMMKNIWKDPKYRSKCLTQLIARNKTMVLSDESRAKISASSKSRIVTDETRAKLSKAGAGRKPSPEHAAKLREMGAARSAFLKARTHCKHGHSLADAMVRKSDNERICRTCCRLRGAARRLKKKQNSESTFPASCSSDSCDLFIST